MKLFFHENFFLASASTRPPLYSIPFIFVFHFQMKQKNARNSFKNVYNQQSVYSICADYTEKKCYMKDVAIHGIIKLFLVQMNNILFATPHPYPDHV